MEAKTCAQCLKPAAGKGISLSTCSGCRRVAYCGKSCQKLHWELGHREQCTQPKRVTKETMEKATDDEASAATPPSTAKISKASEKGGTSVGNDKECANCLASQSREGAALQVCTRCKAVSYCSRACQKQHWGKGGHKQFCVSLEDRRVKNNIDHSRGEKPGGDECPICLEALRPDSLVATLPCSHSFHGECVQGLRRFGVLQACPLCRADLPPGPEQQFESAIRRYFLLERRLEISGRAWQKMEKGEKQEMAKIHESL